MNQKLQHVSLESNRYCIVAEWELVAEILVYASGGDVEDVQPEKVSDHNG